MHIYRQIHVYAHIYLPEGVGMEMKLLRCCSPNINRVKSRFGALQAQEEFAAAAQPLWDLCWLDFSALGLLGRCYNCGLYKNAWKGFFLQSWRVKNESGEGMKWDGQQSADRIMDCLGWKSFLGWVQPCTQHFQVLHWLHIFEPSRDADPTTALGSAPKPFQCRNSP